MGLRLLREMFVSPDEVEFFCSDTLKALSMQYEGRACFAHAIYPKHVNLPDCTANI